MNASACDALAADSVADHRRRNTNRSYLRLRDDNDNGLVALDHRPIC